MTLAFIIYLIQFLDSIKIAAIFSGIGLTALALIHFLAWTDAGTNETLTKSKKSDGSGEMLVFHKATRLMGFVKRYLACAAIAVACAILIPSQRTAYMMAGGYVTQAIAESPAAAEIGNKVLRLINVRLDTMINDELDNLTKTEKKDGSGQAVKSKN